MCWWYWEKSNIDFKLEQLHLFKIQFIDILHCASGTYFQPTTTIIFFNYTHTVQYILMLRGSFFLAFFRLWCCCLPFEPAVEQGTLFLCTLLKSVGVVHFHPLFRFSRWRRWSTTQGLWRTSCRTWRRSAVCSGRRPIESMWSSTTSWATTRHASLMWTPSVWRTSEWDTRRRGHCH